MTKEISTEKLNEPVNNNKPKKDEVEIFVNGKRHNIKTAHAAAILADQFARKATDEQKEALRKLGGDWCYSPDTWKDKK